jgi:hypothetical protein
MLQICTCFISIAPNSAPWAEAAGSLLTKGSACAAPWRRQNGAGREPGSKAKSLTPEDSGLKWNRAPRYVLFEAGIGSNIMKLLSVFQPVPPARVRIATFAHSLDVCVNGCIVAI